MIISDGYLLVLTGDVRKILRITDTSFDTEIEDLILSAVQDLAISGITEEKIADETDALIKRAIITYCKANFGWDNPDSERLQQAYVMLKMHLTLTQEYITEAVV